MDFKCISHQGGDKGWFIPLRQHSVSGDSDAVGAIVMALANPGYGKPSLLNFQEVDLVARQAGKVLQHFLGRTKWAEISCITPPLFSCKRLKILNP